MKNDFAKQITSFFTEFLAGERGVSQNTIRSYSNTFSLFLNYMDEVALISAEKIRLEHLVRDRILGFLDWLQDNRKNGNSTRNQRLAAIHAFCKYMQYEDITHLEQWQNVLSIKIKKTERHAVNYLTLDAVKLLLEQIPRSTKTGRRDLALVALLYDSGARVQELIDLTPSSIHMDKPYYITLFGKGKKIRLVPLVEQQIVLLKGYMEENGLDKLSCNQHPLFQNNRGEKLTNAGITYILKHYANNARVINPEIIPEGISPHIFRHSKAMHLLQAGVNLVYIRDMLGHVSIQTTEIYARADSKQKREALEAAYIDVIPASNEMRSWEKSSELRVWLKSLGK
jgi:site-specific recombinase XerD